MTSQDLITDPIEEATDQMAWGDNFIQIGDSWYSKPDNLLP